MKIDGGCHCGYITYEAEVDPDRAMICHCTDCQTLTGSAFRTVILSYEDAFVLRSGELKIYVKTGESGNQRPQAFCPQCGTPIYSTTLGGGPKVYVVRLGTVRQRDHLIPRAHVWSRSAQKWLGEMASMRAFEKQPVFDRAGDAD
jgi:hypothetical protein